jgi:hypothetical protein
VSLNDDVNDWFEGKRIPTDCAQCGMIKPHWNITPVVMPMFDMETGKPKRLSDGGVPMMAVSCASCGAVRLFLMTTLGVV